MVTRERTLRALPALCLLVALHPAGAAADVLQARGPGGELLLIRDGGEHRVEIGGGRVRLPLGPRAEVSDFRSAAGGWLVAATEVVEGRPVLAILSGRGDRVEALPPPPAGPADVVREPRLLAGRDGLEGLLWLEGEGVTRLEVRAARWRSGGWETPATVSPPGRGTQIALTAAVLADGSYLAAWAAFDGRDDEILWSRLAGGKWSRPRPVAADNRVPDITPRLRAAGAGALVAWSRYDGNDYRLQVARFDGGAWRSPATIGPRGSLYPTFSAGARPLLVFRQASPRGWGVLELDDEGAVLRAAAVEAPGEERPIVSEVSDRGIVLRWAGGASPRSAQVRWSSSR